MITVKTIPSLKEIMFITYNIIHVSYGLLIRLSDRELQTSIYHEMGHIEQFSKMCILFLIWSLLFTILFTILIIIIPLILIPFLMLSFYIVCCWINRLGEYHADIYALKCSDMDRMKEFIHGLNHDTHWMFYPFRWHPSNKKRIDLLSHL